MTEKQYNNIYLVTGEPDYQEKVIGINSHIAKAILEEYQPENTSDMTSALKDIFKFPEDLR